MNAHNSIMGARLSGWIALATVVLFKLLLDGRFNLPLFERPSVFIFTALILTALSLGLIITAIHAEERLNKLLGTVSLGGLLMSLLTLAGR